jgi:5-methylcytosine-specific restriction endonuclease McrA
MYRATGAGAEILRAGFKRYAQTEHGRRAKAQANRRFRQKPENAEKDRIHARQYREALYGIVCDIPMGYEALVLEIFGHQCAACGRPGTVGELTLDHHRPLREGHALLHNAVPLCRRCNVRKNRKAPENFYGHEKLAEITRLLAVVRGTFAARFGTTEAAC